MVSTRSIIQIAVGVLLNFASAFASVENRQQVEDLFLWKISDEMKLAVPEEKKLSDLMKGLNQRRRTLGEEIQNNLKNLSLANNSRDKEKKILEQKRLLRQYNEIAVEEIDKIQKILGVERASQYLVLKNDLTNRLKSALSFSDKSDKVPSNAAELGASPPILNQLPHKLPPPVVIEEK